MSKEPNSGDKNLNDLESIEIKKELISIENVNRTIEEVAKNTKILPSFSSTTFEKIKNSAVKSTKPDGMSNSAWKKLLKEEKKQTEKQNDFENMNSAALVASSKSRQIKRQSSKPLIRDDSLRKSQLIDDSTELD